MSKSVVLVLRSIVECEADVIVNSANTDLIMGTGVAAAILYEAGSEVEEEAIRQGPVQVGDVVVTGPGNLAAQHILHVAVVGEVPPDIEDCTARVLDRAAELGARSIVFPALGTGSAGVSAAESAHAMCQAIAEHCRGETSIQDIEIALWDEELYPVFEREMRRAGLGKVRHELKAGANDGSG